MGKKPHPKRRRIERPMNRHPHLTRFSWEHHSALIVATRILQGLERGADPRMIADYTLHTWDGWLADHNRQEEELLSGHIARLPLDPRTRGRLLTEHEEMQQLSARLSNPDERLPALLNEFAGTLRIHVRFEEQELFPALERLLPIDELARINDALEEEYQAPDVEWREAFWE